ncbi:MAG: glycosyltransferase [Deltaproteobacteria bacterium]|nr:glycosyltransferase [Deltaproteobacteria bacterium]
MIKVSVCLQTYNHASYIKKALESVLMQETDFDYEIIVGEDESSDGTREICIDYAGRYPDRIRLFLRSRKDVIYINGRATGRFNFTENLKAATGKYIALLDGDDYWTDPNKLQEQADFMDTHPGYTVCFHRVQELNEATDRITAVHPAHVKKSYGLTDLLRLNFIPTVSAMVRKDAIGELPDWFYKIPVGDWPLFIHCARRGSIRLINKVMAVYRNHAGGYWSQSLSAQLQMNLEIYDFFKQHLEGKEYQKEIRKGVSDAYCRAAVVSASLGKTARAKRYFLKSIAVHPMLYVIPAPRRAALFLRLYTPPLYRVWKRVRDKLVQRPA